MVYSIEQIRDIVAPIARKYNMKAVYLFGSYARGEATEHSDIDLIIDTDGTEIKSLLALAAVYCDMEEAFEMHIDLITLSSLEQKVQMPSEMNFRGNVNNERVNIYAAA